MFEKLIKMMEEDESGLDRDIKNGYISEEFANGVSCAYDVVKDMIYELQEKDKTVCYMKGYEAGYNVAKCECGCFKKD